MSVSEPEELLSLSDEDGSLPVENNRRLRRRKKQFRWKLIHDLALSNEVNVFKPFTKSGRQSTEAWKAIAKSEHDLYSVSVDHLSVSRRFHLILKAYRQNDKKNRYKSGTEEDVSNLDNILADLASQIDDVELQRDAQTESKQKKVDEQKVKAEEIRSAATTTVKRKCELDEAPQKRVSDSSLISLWKFKQDADQQKEKIKEEQAQKRLEWEKEEREKDRQIKQVELKMATDKITLEREQFEHQRRTDEEKLKLRQRELDLQEEERKSQMNTQKTLLELLLKKL